MPLLLIVGPLRNVEPGIPPFGIVEPPIIEPPIPGAARLGPDIDMPRRVEPGMPPFGIVEPPIVEPIPGADMPLLIVGPLRNVEPGIPPFGIVEPPIPGAARFGPDIPRIVEPMFGPDIPVAPRRVEP